MGWGWARMIELLSVLPATRARAGDQITSVETFLVRVPLPQPVRNGTALITEREYLLVRVTTASGAIGVGCAFTRSAPLRPIVDDFLAPQIIGRSVFDVQNISADLFRSGELFLGRTGAFPRALSLVDIALWDAMGSISGLSLAEQLGGSGAGVPTLMALGYYQSGDEIELLQAEYSELVDQGFRRFKMMAGGATLEHDVRRVAAVKEVLPPDATLAVDVNGAWASAREALTFLDAVDTEFSFIEDPFLPDNLAALTAFRKHSSAIVAVGEWESSRYRFLELLKLDLLDIARVDATAVGGITEWMRIAAVVAAHDKRVLPHYYPEIHRHLVAACPVAEAIEVVPRLTGADNYHVLVRSTPWEDAPHVPSLTTPGLGIEWNWESIEQLGND